MKIIKKEVDYAIRALIYIHQKGGKASAKEIYSDIKAPKPFIRKILQALAKAGMLESEKGKGGGFSLKIRFENINLKMLSDIFSPPPMRRGECPFRNRLCNEFGRCKLKSKIYQIEQEVLDKMSQISLSELWR